MTVFFIRRSNDIDHLTPVIWAAARAGEPVRVLSMNPYLDLDGDYRLSFLRQAGIRVDHLYEIAPALVGRLVVSPRALGRVARALLVERWWDKTRARQFTVEWATRALRRLDANLLVFDWVKPEQHVTAELLEAARRLGIPTVALPHGVTITTGELRTRAAARVGRLPDYDAAFPFDAFVAPHHDHADYFARGGMPRQRMHVLGSARFCDEWVREGVRIAPPAGLTADDGRLKVAFFDKDSFSLDATAADASLRRIAGLDYVRLAVKPQTRNNLAAVSGGDRLEFVPDVPSVSLVAWADVVVGTVSSILIEPLCQGKTLLYPRHHCAIRTRLQDMGACTEVHDDDALESALGDEWRQRGAARAGADAVRACLDEIVYAGDSDRDVLGRHVRFLRARPARQALAS